MAPPQHSENMGMKQCGASVDRSLRPWRLLCGGRQVSGRARLGGLAGGAGTTGPDRRHLTLGLPFALSLGRESGAPHPSACIRDAFCSSTCIKEQSPQMHPRGWRCV